MDGEPHTEPIENRRETTTSVSGARWQNFAAVLEASTEVRHGRIVIRPMRSGKVALDMISLFPREMRAARRTS